MSSLPVPLRTLLTSPPYNSAVPLSQIPLLLQISSKMAYVEQDSRLENEESGNVEMEDSNEGFSEQRRHWSDILKELQKKSAKASKPSIKSKKKDGSSTVKKTSGASSALATKKASSSAMKTATSASSKPTKNTQSTSAEKTSSSEPSISINMFAQLYQIMPNVPSVAELKRDVLMVQREAMERAKKENKTQQDESTGSAPKSVIVTEEEALRAAEQEAKDYGVSVNDLKVLKDMGLLDLNRGKDLKEILEEETQFTESQMGKNALSKDAFRTILQMVSAHDDGADESSLTPDEMEELLSMLTNEDGHIEPELFVSKIAESIEQTQTTLAEIQEEQEEEKLEEEKAKAATNRHKNSSTIAHQSGRAKFVAKK